MPSSKALNRTSPQYFINSASTASVLLLTLFLKTHFMLALFMVGRLLKAKS